MIKLDENKVNNQIKVKHSIVVVIVLNTMLCVFFIVDFHTLSKYFKNNSKKSVKLFVCVKLFVYVCGVINNQNGEPEAIKNPKGIGEII